MKQRGNRLKRNNEESNIEMEDIFKNNDENLLFSELDDINHFISLHNQSRMFFPILANFYCNKLEEANLQSKLFKSIHKRTGSKYFNTLIGNESKNLKALNQMLKEKIYEILEINSNEGKKLQISNIIDVGDNETNKTVNSKINIVQSKQISKYLY
jgi:hypothetical protein